MSVSQSPSNSNASSPISKTESQLVQPIEPVSPAQSTFPQEQSVRRSTRPHTKPQLFNEIDEQGKKPSRSVQSGRKRRIVFEGDDAEDRRKKFLERNRIAAYKCRQKKKTWMQELEQHAEMANSQNEELRSTVAQLKEESMYLRNMLLTHGNCDCETVQSYLRKTSAQLTAGGADHHRSPIFSSYPDSRRTSTTSYTTMPPLLQNSLPQPFQEPFTTYPEQSTGLTPFLNTVINKEVGDYFS
ncbi:hypothetical protein K501DRAFT_177201 [Backusella circina FSU 941]|nr:hypothetical protein K501DRAFT_177201 [Backusella circina FSU 941]